jgi:cyclophilin family peptidyl-prolyl cis-trans isomerase
MCHPKFLCMLLLQILLIGCDSNERAFEEILRLEDRRAPASEFARYVTKQNSAVQRRAIVALGRLQDPEAVPLLTPLLTATDASTRVEAAFALGQLGQSHACNLLLRGVADEKDLEARLALIEAVSKTAGDAMMSAVSDAILDWLNDPIPIVRAEAALAAGRLAYRGLKNVAWRAPLAHLLGDADDEVRWRAAYALMRLYSGNQTKPDSTVANKLIMALSDRNARVRMQAARALGVIKPNEALDPLTQAGRHDSDWRVRVNATAALSNFDFDDLPARLAVQDTVEHVRLTALRTLGITAERMLRQGKLTDTSALAEFLRGCLQATNSRQEHEITWREQAAAASALAQIFREKAAPDLAPFIAHPNPYFRSKLAEALGATAAAEALPYLKQMAQDTANVVRIAVLEALPKLPASMQPQATAIYLEALRRGDAVLTALAAQNLAADSLQRYLHAAAIIDGYRQLKPPVDVEAAQMIFTALAKCGNLSARALLEEALQFSDKPFARAAAEALKNLTGQEYRDRIPKETQPQQDFTYQEIEALADASATIQTNKGAIALEFFPEMAPLTVLNFVRLAKRGFFDRLLIPRVVPNFVIQTGDPRGDIWGSPGYSIRSEFSRLRYLRGMVGMASIGPDTEGCQFFITHSDQPHLDGRYTIFARVRHGMEVVDNLQVGDRMERVTVQF